MSNPILPEISFASYDPSEIEAALIGGYETASGRVLYPADPVRLFLSAIAAAIIQERFLLDDSARNTLLAFAAADYLDALGDLVGATRLPAVASSTTVQFTLAAAPGAGNSLTIPAGTRVAKAGTQLYWATDGPLTISNLATTGSITATCQTTGAITNGYAIGELTSMVDIVAGVASARNTAITTAGADAETDDALRARIRLAPTAFSSAGPRDSYIFWARSASALIADVSVDSPDAGLVDVYVLLQNGGLPDASMLAAVEAVLSADSVRPLTDVVTAKAPAAVAFTVNLTYYIDRDDAARASEIQTAVTAAVADYVSWQQGAIGRDVNPSKLIQFVENAGAKRVTVTTPVYAAVSLTQVANITGAATVNYGGLEDA